MFTTDTWRAFTRFRRGDIAGVTFALRDLNIGVHDIVTAGCRVGVKLRFAENPNPFEEDA
jgi:hypothetical protein